MAVRLYVPALARPGAVAPPRAAAPAAAAGAVPCTSMFSARRSAAEGGAAARWPAALAAGVASALAVTIALVLPALALPASAAASANPAEMLTYMPTELVHSEHAPAEVQGVLGELAEYGIGQALFQMPRFTKKGTIKLSASNERMLRVWAEQAAAYDAEH